MESKGTDWTQKGTGWVQSPFDPNDYTLQSEIQDYIKNRTTDGIETIGETAQIESLSRIISELLELPVFEGNNETKRLTQELKRGVVNIKQVKVHKLLKKGDCDIQILRVKDLLRRFFSQFPSHLENGPYEPELTFEFDDDTYRALHDFCKNYLENNFFKAKDFDKSKLLKDFFDASSCEDDEIYINVNIMTALNAIVKASEDAKRLYVLADCWIRYIDSHINEKVDVEKKFKDGYKGVLARVKLIQIFGWVKEEVGPFFIELDSLPYGDEEPTPKEKRDRIINHTSKSSDSEEPADEKSCNKASFKDRLETIKEKLEKEVKCLKKCRDDLEITTNISLQKNDVLFSKPFSQFWDDADRFQDALCKSVIALIKALSTGMEKDKDFLTKAESETDLSLRRAVGLIHYAEGMMWTLLGNDPLPLLPQFLLFESNQDASPPAHGKEYEPAIQVSDDSLTYSKFVHSEGVKHIPSPIPTQVFDLFLNQLKKRSKELKQWCEYNPELSDFVKYQTELTQFQPKSPEIQEKSNRLKNLIISRISEGLIPKISPLGGRNLKLAIKVQIAKIEKQQEEVNKLQNSLPGNKSEEEEEEKLARLRQELLELVDKIIQKFQDKEINNVVSIIRRQELLEFVSDQKAPSPKPNNPNPESESTLSGNLNDPPQNDPSQQYYQENIYLPVKGTQDSQVEQVGYYSLPEFVDLSYWCSDIANQGRVNSCTAQSGIALIEYFDKRINKSQYTPLSARFLYKASRNFMKRQGDSGAGVRDVMKTMIQFGVCPASHWPEEEDKFDEEPNSFCYSFAQNYQTIKYFRLDKPDGSSGMSRYALLTQIKALLTAGFPCMFGFTVYSSIHAEENVRKGRIPYPSKELDRMEGGHSLVAVGYDNNKVIENAEGEETTGAFLVRNSWGKAYGIGGYGYLPFKYVLEGLTADWWSLIKTEWIKPGELGINWDDSGGHGTIGCGKEHCWCGKHLDTKQPLSQ